VALNTITFTVKDNTNSTHFCKKNLLQLKFELRTEIVRDVTRKTVKQVLKGLDGAVIQSMKGGNSADVSEATVSSTKTEVKEPEIPITSPFKKEIKETAVTASSHRKYLNKINSNINCQGKS
jgi:hypothetical protein